MAGETLFVAGANGLIYALNKLTGEPLWQLDPGAGSLSRPLHRNELLMVASTEQSMVFIDAVAGRKIMHRFARKNISGDPVLGGSEGNLLVYLSNAGRLYCLQLKDSFR